MPLIRFVAPGNFGDDLNDYLWDEIFPNLSSLTDFEISGIGTVLSPQDSQRKSIVLGSGISHNANGNRPLTDFRWVRGPLTAEAFKLPKKLALGDPAILWSGLKRISKPFGPVGFIPHCLTWTSYDWDGVAKSAGLMPINPYQSPQKVVQQMATCSRILTESLHGAIFADAMGIPWAPCILAHRFNSFKWRDWMLTIGRPFDPMIVDTPLINSISKWRASTNYLAKILKYGGRSGFPSLRPTKASKFEDCLIVSESLQKYTENKENFFLVI